MEKNATALRGRRNAVRQQKAQNIKGHLFVKKFFRQFTYCSLCHDFLWFVSPVFLVFMNILNFCINAAPWIINIAIIIYQPICAVDMCAVTDH